MARLGFGHGNVGLARRTTAGGGNGGGGGASVLPAYASIVTIGDSITVGVNASTAAKRWANIVAARVGGTLLNAGISGTVLQNSLDSTGAARASNGRNRFVTDVLGANLKAAIFIAYGFNDARYTGAPTTFNATEYANDYREVLNGLIIGGYARADIYVGTPFYIIDAGLNAGSAGFTGQTRAGFETFVQAATDVAAEYGVQFCNLYAWLRDNGYAATVDTDFIHPLDAGHALIAQCWQTQTVLANRLGAPATVTMAVAAQTVTVTAAAVSGAASYEYVLVANPLNVAQNTTGIFASVAAGAFYAKARAVFSGGTKGPWTMSATNVAVAAGAGATTGQTESYAATTDDTPLTATAPTLGLWTQNGYSTGSAAVAGNAIRGPVTQSQLAVAHLASAALGNGVFAQAALLVKSNTAALMSAGVVVRSDPAAQSYLAAFYNGTNIRLFKAIAGTLTQIGSTYTVVLAVGSAHTLRLEATAGGQSVYLDGALIITGAEAEANLAALGTGLGIRLQTGLATVYTSTTGPVFTGVSVGTL